MIINIKKKKLICIFMKMSNLILYDGTLQWIFVEENEAKITRDSKLNERQNNYIW